MKKILIVILSVLLAAGVFAGCAANGQTQPEQKTSSTSTEAATPDAAGSENTAEPEATPYAFELTDIDGNVHRLSDYNGKPVYLKIWGSWCSYCVASLPDLNELAAEAKDFTVISVVPRISGEKDREDFIKWFKQQGYDNITVLYDESAQIVKDFGVTGFPTQIFFDENGVAIYGAAGVLENNVIFDTMDKIINGEAN